MEVIKDDTDNKRYTINENRMFSIIIMIRTFNSSIDSNYLIVINKWIKFLVIAL